MKYGLEEWGIKFDLLFLIFYLILANSLYIFLTILLYYVIFIL